MGTFNAFNFPLLQNLHVYPDPTIILLSDIEPSQTSFIHFLYVLVANGNL